jgi:peroxiredoxin Q/BCP
MRLLSTLAAGASVLALGAFTMHPAVTAGEKGKTMLKVGDKAPAFESVDDNGKPWKSSDHVGKKIVVLYFFPAALTGG